VKMLSTWESTTLVILIVISSLLFKEVINRFWTAERRRTHNDLIGWQLSIVGTTYAVILGFMLYTVWTEFEAASANADAEASSVMNVYRLAEGLPAAQRDLLKQTAREYVDTVINEDWPAMERGEGGIAATHPTSVKMWKILMTVKGASPTEITAEDHALYELSAMSEHRRLRQLQATARLPAVLWFVLTIGGMVTIMSSCMFGAESSLLHGLQVLAFSLLIALVLVAIADINRPYQGTVHVSDAAFRRAQMYMSQ